MAENEPPLTPEKQLLKLIENPKQDALRAESKKREGRNWFSAAALKGRFSFWKSLSSARQFSLKRFTRSSVGIRQVNTLLKILIALGGLYFGYAVIHMGLELNRASNLIFEPGEGTQEAKGTPERLNTLSYYLEKVSARNIFEKPVLRERKPEEKTEVEPSKTENEDFSKSFSLVGIAWSQNPEAMIEDTAKKKTHFVRRGQTIDEKIRIVTIFKDKVILSIDGKEFELK
ncbi:MAG: hypothetical protein HY587_01730 [Candidatus Omnitrophica bacterium]|nr:hypothetical protein [Candidatus Omnitrophota bacterium]